MSESATFDVIVIGAGVMGCALAYELARRDQRVLVVDKLPAAGYGSTSASSAIIRFTYSHRSGVAMAYEGSKYWGDWANHIGPIGDQPHAEFVVSPMLQMKLPGGHQENFLPHFHELGIPHEDLDRDQAIERYPFVDFRVFGPPATLDDTAAPFWGEPIQWHDGVIVMDESGYINDPALSAQNLAAAAMREGATFQFNTAVTGIPSSDGRVTGVELTDGRFVAAPVVVNAAGPHARIINELAGVLDEMKRTSRALRREVYIVEGPPGVDYDEVGIAMGDADTGVYFRPERGNNILIGNAEPECDELVWVEDPDTIDDTVSGDGFQLHAMRTSRRIKDVAIPLTKRGLVSAYDATPDWTPIYDRSGLDGFYLMIGTSGNQFKNAPIAGHAMAELILAVEDGHDHDNDPVTVVGRYTGFDIDMGTFTRTREVPEDTHMNVFG